MAEGGVRGTRRREGLVAAAALAALLVLVGCAPTSAPSGAASATPDPAASSDVEDVEEEADGDGGSGAGRPRGAEPADVPVHDASLGGATDGAADEAAAATPVALRYDRLDWSMPVDAVGVADDGQMEVPADALRAGWYRFGPGAGAPAGATVLAAHAGSFVTPRGPFWELTGARIGDVVELDRADGTAVRYEVSSLEEIEKDAIDLRPYFARDGDPRLVLITCGGVWDESAQSYESNVVVTAVPIGD